MAATPQFVAVVRTPALLLNNASGTGFNTLVTPGASGTRVDSISVTNSDAANAYVLQFAVQRSGVDYEIGEVTIAAGSGTNGSAKSVAALNATDLPFLAYTEAGALFLEQGALLRVRAKTAVSGSNTVKLVAVAGDY